MQGLPVISDETRDDPGRTVAARCGRFEPFGITEIGGRFYIPVGINELGMGFYEWPATRPRQGGQTAEGARPHKAQAATETEINGC